MRYRCCIYGYVYDPAVGNWTMDVEVGTALENLPDDWVCPDCGAGKDEFETVEN